LSLIGLPRHKIVLDVNLYFDGHCSRYHGRLWVHRAEARLNSDEVTQKRDILNTL